MAPIVTATDPVVWHFFGTPFQAGSMIVGLCAVAITRCIVFLQSKSRKQIFLDIAVSLLCAMVTALWIQENNLQLLSAGLSGVGIASLGIGIIGIARGAMAGRMKAALDAFISGGGSSSSGGSPSPVSSPPPPGPSTPIGDALAAGAPMDPELPEEMQGLIRQMDHPPPPAPPARPTLPLQGYPTEYGD